MIIQNLSVYPVKSLRGVSLEHAEVVERGLDRDRRWMLVDAEGVFLTQRTFPAMATVGVEIEPDGLVAHREGMSALRIPLEPGSEPIHVRVWNFECDAPRVSDEVDQWFSEALGVSARLVYMPDDLVRAIPDSFGGGMVGFSDALPILVVSKESLNELNRRLEAPIPIDRFRPNIVLEGAGSPHAEDDWQEIAIGDVLLRRAKKCGRCAVTTTDQRTGERGIEPLRTLAQYRKDGNTVFFGCYYTPVRLGSIGVGDAVDVE